MALARALALPILAALLALTTASAATAREEPKNVSVAIVGAGVGGTSAAFWLRGLLGPTAQIDVYEREAVGGRARSASLDGVTVEVGASMVWKNNRYIKELAEAVGLETEATGKGVAGGLALHDGRSVVWRESPWLLVTLLRSFWDWGFAPFVYPFWPRSVFSSFEGVYDLQSAGESFATPADLLAALGPAGDPTNAYALTQQNLQEAIYAAVGDPSGPYPRQFLGAINRVNYNQPNEKLNAFAGACSTLPAVDPGTFRIQGGNARLPARLLELSKARLVTRNVEEISWDDEGEASEGGDGARGARNRRASAGPLTYAVSSRNTTAATGGGPATETVRYDAVLIAAPLELAGLALSGPGPLPHLPSRSYRRTVATFVRGRLRREFLGDGEGFDTRNATACVLLTGDAEGIVNSVCAVSREDPGEARVWKIFSSEPLDETSLTSAIFEKAGFSILLRRDWLAYPEFNPPEDFSPFLLRPGLFYNSALENAASAMEIAAIAARNSATLIAEHFGVAVGARGGRRAAGSGTPSAVGKARATAAAAPRGPKGGRGAALYTA